MVRTYVRFALFAILALMTLVTQAAQAQTESLIDTRNEIPSITVLADRALTVPLTMLVSIYSRQHKASVTVTFAPNFEQTLAIEEGVPADIFISAHPESLLRLQQQGLFDVYSMTPLVDARLKLVSAANNAYRLNGFSAEAFKELNRSNPEFLIAITNSAATAEGYFTAQVMKKLREGGVFMYGHLVEFQNADDVLQFVNEGKGLGIIFRSDVEQHSELVSQADIPTDWHAPITFNGVVLAGPAMETSRHFLNYLSSPEAQRVFIKYGLYPSGK